ncbi:hypothetical protein ANAPC5_01374 [Anaplasma phagocytophilum]|nr:hypothetical protein ANAPC5_01374 [Anaplasma phagocytophilum]
MTRKKWRMLYVPPATSTPWDCPFSAAEPIGLLLNYVTIKENAGNGVPRAARAGVCSSNCPNVELS